MEIYLMQHGPNQAKEQDPEEGLSPQGRLIVQAGARALANMGLVFDSIITSPKLRARQTAEIAAGAAGFDVTHIAVTGKVRAMADPALTLDALAELDAGARVLIAGHMPNLSGTASLLLAGNGRVSVAFDRGAVCRIDAQKPAPGQGSLRWFLLPDQLKRMAP